MLLERMAVGPFATNCYLVACPETKEAIIIDPGAAGERIILRVQELKLKVRYVVNTHAHIDHIGANEEVRRAFQVPLLAHKADLQRYHSPQAGIALFMEKVEVEPPDDFIQEGDSLQVGTLQVKVLDTPGHSPGGITLDINGVLFAGDTLFAGSIGRTDFPGGSFPQLIQSIKDKILSYPDDTKVYPGHGPPTTVGDERRYNPFLT
ncbi:MAG: MBL fold metallo-hydrolase [Firmicutes bacterium]|nr:MBL fold metallo-hydrolase [Bacillota bacterium]